MGGCWRVVSFVALVLFCASGAPLPFTPEGNAFSLPKGSYLPQPRTGMFLQRDSPAGEGESSVSLQLQFKRSNTKVDAIAEVVIIEAADHRTAVGLTTDNSRFCCTNQLFDAKEDGCDKVGTLIIPESVRSGGKVFEVTFAKDQGTFDLSRTFTIPSTGTYWLLYSNCDASLENVDIEGDVKWLNPYGYLPGELYGFLPFYGWMTLAYVAAGVVWLVLCAMFWKDLLQLQNVITAVLALCMLEMATWYLDYHSLNNVGYRKSLPFTIGVATTVIRRTVSRMLVVSVSMGYGVVRPTLGESRSRVLFLGAIYLLFGSIYEIFVHYSQAAETSMTLRLLVTFPVALLDGTFYWWIFISLSKVLVQLQSRKQHAKLALYQNFSRVLGASLLMAVAFAMYHMYYINRGLYNTEWSRFWFMETGFWQVLYTLVLFAIMILWRPSEHAKRYAFAQQIGQDDMEESDDELDRAADAFSSELAALDGTGHMRQVPDHPDSDYDEDMEQQKSALFTIDSQAEASRQLP